ncbi:hypothetical protein, partial [Endozoicomonas sp. ALC013]|uniref:hypothetical protein n=1 Tax=Endozoicomonas sp. ALC013 TaxID=3403076 RepID=UPI003BB5BF54
LEKASAPDANHPLSSNHQGEIQGQQVFNSGRTFLEYENGSWGEGRELLVVFSLSLGWFAGLFF